MLDQETKKRIDDCRNILVGKVPDPKSQVEQITIAMIYKFMYDMDLESLDMGGVATYFIGEYEKYSWKNIFDPRIGGNEMISLYGEGIVKMNLNPNIPQLFRDIFKNAYLPYRDPETLKLFLKGINVFHYSHSEKLGDAFEYLLSVLGSQGDAGQFRTPRHIIDFMVELLQPKKSERILDPACGTSGFLISSYKHILRNNTKKNIGDLITVDERNQMVENISGYDISPDMVRLSLVNLYLHNFSNPKIYEYDSLTSEDRWNEYYDVILANPPFMSPKGGIKPHKRFSIESNRAEVLFVDYIMEHLTPKGRSGIVVPEGIIFQSGTAYKSLRKLLVEKYLVGVISLPSGVFQPYSGVKTSILILDKELSQKTEKIFFGKVDNDGFDLGAQRREIEKNDLPILTKEVTEYLEGLRNHNEVKSQKLTYVNRVQILASNDIGLSYDKYSNERINQNEFINVKIGDICQIIRGITFGKNDQLFHESDDSIRVVTTRAAQENGIVEKNIYFIPKRLVKSEEKKLIAGDILISTANSLNLIGRTTFVREIIKETSFGAFMTLIRVEKKKILPVYLLHILKTDGVLEYFRVNARTTTNISNLSNSAISDLEIPLPPIEVQEEIVHELEQYQKIIDGAKQVVDNYKPVIEIDPSWEMKELGKVFETSSGGTPLRSKSEYYNNGTIPWLRSGEVNDGFIYSTELKISEMGMKNSSAKLFPKDTVLIAMYGATVGQVGILKIESTTNQAVCGILPNNFHTPEFIYYFLKQKREELVNLSVGGAQPNISQGIIKSLMVPLISLEIQQSIVERIESERQIIEGNKKLIQIYTQKIQDRINKIWGE
jgi:type I restriction enzyme M protein